MKRNTKIKLMAIVAAAVALVALVLTTTVFASSSSSSATSLTNNTRQDFIDKVASNLGLTSDQVTAAFDKAQNQTLDEQIQERLQEAVTNGTITQEESDQILEWWTSRPDALSKLGMGFLGQGGTGMGGEGIGSRGGNGCPMRRGSEANIEDRVSGTVASIDAADSSFVVTESDGTTQVTVKYTSSTRFMLDGVISLAVGQQVTAGGQTNDDGSLAAVVVRVAESSSTDATA